MMLEQAHKQGITASEVTLPMAHIARSIEWGYDLGFYRMVIDTQTNLILGATLAGYETAELVHVFLSLMEAKAMWQVLEQSVHFTQLTVRHCPVSQGYSLEMICQPVPTCNKAATNNY
ncbi:hypothetical protein [Nostoc sp. KVJ20]|uniref:hypothetical protein n=1 Tax=Nostoc sp. KVJ20 TaxID=457944 RepID=UPI000AFF14AA|nr:hypothetical protein [Nostoc sp. KVJ20]